MKYRESVSLDMDATALARRFDHVYRGTGDSDRFVGTDGADKWLAGDEGFDEFDGRGGVDRVVIDYSQRVDDVFGLTRGSDDYSYSGVAADGYGESYNSARFDNVEEVHLTGSTAAEYYFFFDLPPLGPDQWLKIDTGGGGDILELNMAADQTADMTFVVGGDGHARGTLGDLYGFSTYTVYLGSGDDLLTGSPGSDRLEGAMGDDTIKGGGGDDIIYGTEGADVLTGGGGADNFAFYTLADFATGAKLDTITDFSGSSGEHDFISFNYVGSFTFIGAAKFDGNGTAELRATQIDGGYLVRGDVDGDGHRDLSLIVLTDAPLTAADFGAAGLGRPFDAAHLGLSLGTSPELALVALV